MNWKEINLDDAKAVADELWAAVQHSQGFVGIVPDDDETFRQARFRLFGLYMRYRKSHSDVVMSVLCSVLADVSLSATLRCPAAMLLDSRCPEAPELLDAMEDSDEEVRTSVAKLFRCRGMSHERQEDRRERLRNEFGELPPEEREDY